MKDIKVYTSDNCGACKLLKSYLSASGIKFKEVNLNSPEKINQFIEETGTRTIPVVSYNGKHIIGFDRNEIDALAKLVLGD